MQYSVGDLPGVLQESGLIFCSSVFEDPRAP